MTDKNDLTAKTTRQLKARRRRLARSLPDVEAAIAGSVVDQGRRCGKEGCRCATGELTGLIPTWYCHGTGPHPHGLRAGVGGRGCARNGTRITADVRAALEEISVINIELLSRGELG